MPAIEPKDTNNIARLDRQTTLGGKFDAAPDDRAVIHLCTLCDTLASVIDDGVLLCGQCYLLSVLRRDALAAPSKRAGRVEAALQALRRILDETDESCAAEASRRPAPFPATN